MAARNNDSRSAFAIIRCLGGGGSSRVNVQIKLKSGEHSTGEVERQERWLEHFADTFGGNIVSTSDLQPVKSDSLSVARDFKTSPELTRSSIMRLGRNKGSGRDGIPCEVPEVGESAVACKLHDLQDLAVQDEQWPVPWECWHF